MLLNFLSPSRFKHITGIDLLHYKDKLGFSHLSANEFKTRCKCCWMGFTPSPFNASAFYYIALEFVMGNHLDKTNHLRWDRVKSNLPGSKLFNPALLWIMKWNDLIENTAADIVAFIDDLRYLGVDGETAWTVGRYLGTRLQYLGVQDTPQKNKIPYQDNESA